MIRIAFSTILLSTLLISCKKELAKEVNRENIFFKDSVKVDFEFPDTIYKDFTYKGVIKYKSALDTITTSFEDKYNDRYIVYYMIKNEGEKYSIQEIMEMKVDTFGALNNSTIPFKVKFSKLGINYIDGVIYDYVLIDTASIHKKTDKIRYIEKEARATHKVVVIEKPISKSRTL